MSFSSLWGYGRAMALAAALTALPALAQDQSQNQADQQDNDQFSQQSSDQFSQQGNQQFGQQSNQQFGQQTYNQGTETTLEGTVVAVNPNTPTGEHVVVDTSQGQYDVHLGPQWYLQQQQASLQPGQRISVTGSQSTINNQQAIIARQVTANGNTITLRTASGIPLWSGASQNAFAGQQQGFSGQQGQFSQAQQQGQFTPYAPEEENPLAYEQGGPQGQFGQQGQFAQQGQFGQQNPYAMQQGQYGPYASNQPYPQTQYGGYQQNPYAMQQGQVGQYQPPMQQTPYMGQPGPFSQGQPMNIGISNWQHGDIYNPFTETTLNGTVQQVTRCSCGPFSSTYATLNTSQGKVVVQLAPSSYLSQNQVQINRGEHIQVTGSKLNVNGNDVILARVVSTPQRTIALRNTQGMPQWTQANQMGRTHQPGFTAGANPSTDNPEVF